MKYIRLKPFKELQAAEVGSDSDGDKIEIIETSKSGSKRSKKRGKEWYASCQETLDFSKQKYVGS